MIATYTRWVAACALLLLTTGCAQIQLGAPAASIENIQKAKAIAPVALGDFGLASGKPASLDTGIGVRGSTISSPVQHSFAQYLKQTLATELGAAGRLVPTANVVIQGWLTDSQLDASMSQGSGSVAAQFVVARDGAKVFDKELRSSATWPSSFIGAEAIPAAINEYSGLYRKLVTKLLEDADFLKAVAR
jgi:hypothetical protein